MKKYYGKEKCRILKQVRAEIAKNNGIDWMFERYGDSNGYSKPSDKYRYKEVSSEEYRKLQDAGFNHESQPSKTNPNNRIIRFTESQTADIDRILSPALRRGVMK